MTKYKIPLTFPNFTTQEIKNLTDCIETSWVSSGKYISEFEEKFGKYCEVKYSTSTSSGTTALHLALLSLGIKSGDEVILPDLTYVSTANVIAYVGAKPVFVDVDEEIWAIDPKKIEEKITKRTKAIIPVHLYGHCADMDPINQIAKGHKLSVVEDACQALGSLYKGRKAGSLADLGAFSFSGAKIITTGEGGMITSNNKKLINNVNQMKSNFTDPKKRFYHEDIGYPYRLTNIQAAVGVGQLSRVDKLIKIKLRNAKTYTRLLKSLDILQLPQEKDWARNTYWLYSVVLKKKGLRNKLINYFMEKGIETRPFFSPLHRLPMYIEKKSYKVTDNLAENGISLPSGLSLSTNDTEHVCRELKKFLKLHA